MVQIVSGTGLERILSAQEVAENRVVQQIRDRVTDGNVARTETLADIQAGQAVERADELTDLVKPELGSILEEEADDDRPADQADRQPRLANLLDDPGEVNRILEETQGVDTPFQQGVREQQAALLTDAYRRALFIATIDPGRAPTVLPMMAQAGKLTSNRF